MDAYFTRVDIKKLQTQRLKLIVAAPLRKTQAEQSQGAVGNLVAGDGKGYGRAAAVNQERVQHADQVGGGVDQRPVQVHENCFHAHSPAPRRVSAK